MRVARLREEKGHTLVELMLILVVLGIIAVATAPNLHSFGEGQRVYRTTSEIESALRRARSIAVTRAVDVRVDIDSAAGRCTVSRDNDGDGVFETQVMVKSFPSDVTISSLALGGSTSVAFNSRGVPDHSGSLVLEGNDGHRRRLDIAAGSGAITVRTPPSP